MFKPTPRHIATALLAAGILSGCSLAPQYVRPQAPIATAYPGDAAAQPGSSAGAPQSADAANAVDTITLGWRQFFPEPRLQALIADALENNRDLRTAALNIQEARAQYNIQSADRLPTIDAVAAGSRAPTGTGNNIATSYQVGLSLASFELDFFGRVRNLSAAALNQYLATEEARQAAQISLVAQVAQAYLAERAFAEQQTLAQSTLEGRQSAYKLAQKRFEVGATSALDLRLNDTLVQSARIALATLARQRAQAGNALTLLVGKPLADEPAGPTLSEQNLVTDIPAGLPSDLLTRRPDIRAAELQLKAANANIGAARAAFFPRISLTAGVGTVSNQLSGLFKAGTMAWTVAPQLVLPIFDAGRNRGNLNLAEVRKDLAVVAYEKSIQTAFREVADALVARGSLDEQIDAQQAFLDAQAERLKLADLRYQNGVASSIEVLDAQRDLFAAQQSLVQTRLLRLTNAIDLYRALGGGLNESAALAPTAAK
ncbi:efflux transporter outer membrane subunit [Undibacterium arcticum]|uniref:Efflux transporter outer membrane subunit n=1 Tax=Undibacterium arcticum TaxID=1762892 RepID=A0ABV7F2D6_9BURK